MLGASDADADDTVALDTLALDTVVLAGVRAPQPSALPTGLVAGLPRRLGTPRLAQPDGSAYGGAAVAPLADAPLALLVVRERGPAFHRSETWRLAELGSIAGRVLATAPVPIGASTAPSPLA